MERLGSRRGSARKYRESACWSTADYHCGTRRFSLATASAASLSAFGGGEMTEVGVVVVVLWYQQLSVRELPTTRA